MSAVNFGTTVSLDEAATLIRTCQNNRFFLRGEPGIGKSSIMQAFKRHFGDTYAYAYFDCAQKDLGDIAMPSMNRDLRVTEYFPNAALQLQTGKPVIIMLDEYTKAPQPVQNMLHPLLEAHNPRLGDVALPVGPNGEPSIVFLTGNMASDGVGDNIKAHTVNRVTAVTVRKPTAEEWLGWAANNDIDPVVMAWVNQFPHALESYLDGNQDSNPYIFNPKKMQGAFVSPRSLEKVSNDVLKKREHNSTNAVLAAMIGTIGESGARDLHAFVDYQDQLPSWESITNSPKTARLPESPGACAVLVFGSIARVDRTTMPSFMDYLERMEPEWQAVFGINIAKNPAKQQIAFTSTKFRNWCTQNVDIL
jgi:hypothetical protein